LMFAGWSGGGCSGTKDCTVTLNSDTTVTATFTLSPDPECTGATVAGTYSGVVAGTDSGTAFSSFLFLTLLSNGTLEVFSVFGEPGLPFQQESATGTWTFFFTTEGFCIIRATLSGGGAFLANFAESGNSIQLSTPNDPTVQAAGVLRRAGS